MQAVLPDFKHDVALVMMDTRDPHTTATAIAQPDFKLRRNASIYYFLTYYLNLRYAERHGYEIIYYCMIEKECQHPLWGARHPSYCKLTAIAHTLALRRHRWVIWIDSDAFIRNVSLPLPALLRAYGAPVEDDEETAVYFGWDSPYTLGPNAGFAVLRNSEASAAQLHAWWNVYWPTPYPTLALTRRARRCCRHGGTSTRASTGSSTRTSSTRCSGRWCTCTRTDVGCTRSRCARWSPTRPTQWCTSTTTRAPRLGAPPSPLRP